MSREDFRSAIRDQYGFSGATSELDKLYKLLDYDGRCVTSP